MGRNTKLMFFCAMSESYNRAAAGVCAAEKAVGGSESDILRFLRIVRTAKKRMFAFFAPRESDQIVVAAISHESELHG